MPKWLSVAIAAVLVAPVLWVAHSASDTDVATSGIDGFQPATLEGFEEVFALDDEPAPLLRDQIARIPRVSDTGVVRIEDSTGLAAAIDGTTAVLSSSEVSPVSVSVQGVGRPGLMGELSSTGESRVESDVLWQPYQVGSVSVEEYWRVDGGIEHGYVLSQSPPGDGPLRVSLDVAGAVPSGGGDTVVLSPEDGSPAVTWSRLAGWDAQGQVLPMSFVVDQSQVFIEVDDDAASFPILIDPTFTQQAYLKGSSTEAGDEFGFSVAVDGDTIVVGARDGDDDLTDSSAAYVFVRSGTTWQQQAVLKASNAAADDNFGVAVAIDGDTIVVGADFEDSNATGVNGDQNNNLALGSGAAYVFTRSGDTWSQQAYLKASNAEEDDYFGAVVAIDGDTIVVGASGEDSNATGVNGAQDNNAMSSSGAAYVFTRSGNAWSQQAYLKASNTETTDYFGWSVDVDGDTIVVGADQEDSDATGVNGDQNNNRALSSGAAYVFTRSGDSWAQQAYLKASNTKPNTNDSVDNDQFGHAVAVDGDTIVVGAFFEGSNTTGVNGDQNNRDGTADYSGAAYIFIRSGDSWAQQAYLKASNTGAGDQFGRSVAVDGDTIVVGADGESSSATGVNGDQDNNDVSYSGAAYVFTRSSVTWSQQAYLKASNPGASDDFGFSVAVDGNTTVVGARDEDSDATGVDGNQDNNDATDSGAGYVFLSLPDSISTITSRPKKSGPPGIFLALSPALNTKVAGYPVLFGGHGATPRGAYSVTLRNTLAGSPQVVLDSGRLSASGALERTVTLPPLSPGTYLLTVSALGAQGQILTLNNRFIVDENRFLSVTPESEQPLIR